jgi:hypothetical protein
MLCLSYFLFNKIGEQVLPGREVGGGGQEGEVQTMYTHMNKYKNNKNILILKNEWNFLYIEIYFFRRALKLAHNLQVGRIPVPAKCWKYLQIKLSIFLIVTLKL